MKISEIFYKKAFYNKSRFLILYGAAGSGKSYFAAQKILTRILSEVPHNILVVRKVAATLRHSVFALFKKLINEESLDSFFKINESNLEITALNGNKIIFKGLDDPEKIKSITGITSIWVEEATELREEDLEQLNLRLRGETKHYKQIIITFNPVSAHHWLKKRFFDKKKDNVYFLKTIYKDNPFIDEEYKKQLESLAIENPHYYKIYALGEWGNLEGLIYPAYDEIEEMPQFFEDEFIGLDFGFNHAYALIHVKIEKRDLYVDELIYERETTNAKVIEKVNRKYPFVKNIQIYADSARSDLISEWRENGFNVLNANKSVFDGIMAVKSFNLKITSRSSNVLKELSSYAWKRNKDGVYLDEPVKINDDAMDAIRYALTPYIKKSGKTKSIKVKYL